MKIALPKKNILDLSLFHLSNVRTIFELVCALGAAGAVFFASNILIPIDYRNHSTLIFSVAKGEGSYRIASKLKEAGLIHSRTGFVLYALLSGHAFTLQTGEYLLSPSMNARTLVQKFASGDVLKETITIKEGWNLRDIAAEFERQGFFGTEDFFRVTGYPGVDYRKEQNLPRPKDFSREFPFLKDKPLHVSLEGYLFPDTYQITRAGTPESFVRQALSNFQAHLTPEIVAAIEAQQKTLFEVITFAALIEKEVRTFEDKKIVAGILQKRMDSNMRLQADASVVYIRDGNYYKVSIEETQIESPYNTYRVYGLPLGPISNPGLESIQAVLEPVESPYWFYLSAADGTTIFTSNFEEHKAAKARYLP